MKKNTPITLVVLDGWGIAQHTNGNAIKAANKKFLDHAWKVYPHTILESSGEAVGLPKGKAGNSETGHMNLGAGFIVEQDVVRISHDIESGTFFENAVLQQAAAHVKQNNSAFHIMGLVGDADVHSEIEHLYALLEFAKRENLSKVYVHVFSDGRDSSPTEGVRFVSLLQQRLEQIGVGKIASVVGRYYAMDRDSRWERTQVAYDLLTKGIGVSVNDPVAAIEQSYSDGVTDEFIKPIKVEYEHEDTLIHDSDAVVFFNFRTDRPRQLTKAFIFDEFDFFIREHKLQDLFFATMTEYEKGLMVSGVCYPSFHVAAPFGRLLADAGMTQLHAAESEKFAHVTYFFNGGHEEAFELEDRIIIPSAKVATYDLEPHMKAKEITDATLKALEEKEYDFVLVNYANPDMVAHTGSFEATVEAIEEVDRQLERLATRVLEKGGAVLVTSDHGNAEVLWDNEADTVDTEHNTNPSPFICISPVENPIELKSGILADVAPTLLNLLGLERHPTMTGRDLLSEISTQV